MPGVGSYRELLERLAVELGVAHEIIFAGNIDFKEVKRYYAAADLHLVPSYIETFNYSAIEAAVTGTRTLMTDRIGSGHWLELCDAAIVAVGRDVAGFAAAMVSALGKQTDARVARAIATCTEETLNVDAHAPQLANLLSECAGPRHGADAGQTN